MRSSRVSGGTQSAVEKPFHTFDMISRSPTAFPQSRQGKILGSTGGNIFATAEHVFLVFVFNIGFIIALRLSDPFKFVS